MGTCKDCEHWRYLTWRPKINNIRLGVCISEHFRIEEEDISELSDVFISGCSTSDFETGEDFGCIHFKQKGE